jgi:hypothetical protein
LRLCVRRDEDLVRARTPAPGCRVWFRGGDERSQADDYRFESCDGTGAAAWFGPRPTMTAAVAGERDRGVEP